MITKPADIHMKTSRELKELIADAARKRGTTITGLFWRGLVKEAPELKDAIVRDK